MLIQKSTIGHCT